MESYKMSDGRWQAATVGPLGRAILATGPSEGDAIEICQVRLNMRTEFLSLSPEQQLEIIVDTEKDLLSTDLSDAVKLIAEIILTKETR